LQFDGIEEASHGLTILLFNSKLVGVAFRSRGVEMTHLELQSVAVIVQEEEVDSIGAINGGQFGNPSESLEIQVEHKNWGKDFNVDIPHGHPPTVVQPSS
jgi:hypothetical protein